MLSFLNGISTNLISDRAHDVMVGLRAKADKFTPMASLVTAILQAEYEDICGEEPPRDLYSLLNQNEYIDTIKKRYSLAADSMERLNDLRLWSNRYKHKKRPWTYSDDTVVECYRGTYELAAGYYHWATGKKVEPWDEAAFQTMYESILNPKTPEDAKKIDDAIKDSLARYDREKAELNKRIEKLNEALAAAIAENKNTKALQATIQNLQDTIRKQNTRIERLNDKILTDNRARVKLLNRLNELEAASDSLTPEQQAEMASLQQQVKELQTVIDQQETMVADQQNQINSLETALRNAEDERDKVINSSDEFKTILEALKNAEGNKSRVIREIQDKADLLAALEKRIKTAQSVLEDYSNQVAAKDRLKNKAEEYLRNNAPKCRNCNTPMSFSPSNNGSGYYWRCTEWRKDGTGCVGGFERSNNAWNQIIKEYYDIINSGGKLVPPPAVVANTINQTAPSHLPPPSFHSATPTSYLFESLRVPVEIFESREKNKIDLFSKFYISTQLPRQRPEEKERAIYSMALRLLNRGAIVHAGAMKDKKPLGATDIKLREAFNTDDVGAINDLITYLSYETPVIPCDSPREQAFAQYYFPKLLGENWASFVFAQVGLDTLVPGDGSEFSQQRVDFYVHKNGRKIVIELDGPEHNETRDHDLARDRYLQRSGYVVRRYENISIDCRSDEILQDLNMLLGESRDYRIDADVSKKYLVATKLCHQFAIAIVKCLEQGHISAMANLKAEVSTKLFTPAEVEYILAVATTEVREILDHYAHLYDLPLQWEFYDSGMPECMLSVGDGTSVLNGGVLIRDCVLPHRMQCHMEDFPTGMNPVKTEEETVVFFLNYLFGYPGFREGQYEAVRRLLQREDAIVLLPTGAGKSIIYQLSSFLVPGLIVVISPLVSLMEDQVQNLQLNHGVETAIQFSAVYSGDDRQKREADRAKMQSNATTLLYLAPERLQIPSFRQDAFTLLEHNNVFAVAVDEAHCVSEWGHDFRAAYLSAGKTAKRIFSKNNQRPVVTALTGTASNSVLNDVRLNLDIQNREAIIKPKNFDREELHFSIKSCPPTSKVDYICNMLQNDLPAYFGVEKDEFVKLQGEKTFSGLVFTPLAIRKNSVYSAMSVARALQVRLPEFRIAQYYSSNPDPKQYKEDVWKATIRENALRFKKNDINVLVCTKAFGMGIDKPNIRFTIHDGLPMSFEQFYQEAGRAARGGMKTHAECSLLFSDTHSEINEMLLDANLSILALQDMFSKHSKETYQNNSSDDISTIMFFHTQAFQGVDVEVAYAVDILDRLQEKGLDANKKILLTVPKKPEVGNDWEKKKIRYENEVLQNNWFKAMVRFSILGIISDYTFDYSKNLFDITCGSLTREDTIKNYVNYVRVNIPDTGRIIREKEKFQNAPEEGLELAKAAIKILVEYVYENIESTRRAAIQTVYHGIKNASNEPDQNAYLKKAIESYFGLEGRSYNLLEAVENATENAGLNEASQVFDLSAAHGDYTEAEKDEARAIAINAGRRRENSGMANHPGLLLVQAMGGLIAGDYSLRFIVNNITAAIQFARKDYIVDDEIMRKAFFPAMSIMLRRYPEVFDELMDAWAEHHSCSTQNVLEELIVSEYVDDENREYLLANYATILYQNTCGRIFK